MVATARHHRYTYAEYVSLEQHSPIRHEFIDGEIYAMAGGTPEHAALAAVTLRLIGNQLPSGCRAYTSDLRVRIDASDLTTYPDGAVVCGRVAPATNDSLAATNPVVLIEVTSPSTEAYDRGAKVDHYKRLASVRDILILSHDERHATLHHRENDGSWSISSARDGETLQLRSIGATLEVSALYADLA